MNTPQPNQTTGSAPSLTSEDPARVIQERDISGYCAVNRLIPSSDSARRAASCGLDHNDYGWLPVKTLQLNECCEVRLLPSFADPTLPCLLLYAHEWPKFELNPLNLWAVCPERTDPLLLTGDRTKPCAACAAKLGGRKTALTYALVDGQPVLLKFTPTNLHVLEELYCANCFDLAQGRRFRLRNVGWALDFKLLDPAPISPQAFAAALALEVLHTRTWIVRPDRLRHMADAFAGWRTSGEAMPESGQSDRLVKLLPQCTLLRIPWGLKGPVESAWQNTPFEMMRSADYLGRLDQGNIGLLCGRDPAAIDKGLLDDRVLIGLDADTAEFADELRRLNRWLDDTFAVEGNRGLKWFFALQGEGIERGLPSTKIMQRRGDADCEVGDWLATGKQGVIWGLHPSGKMYKPNWKPLLTINLRELRLPKNCFLPSQQVRLPSPREHYRKRGGPREGASTGAILHLSRLENPHGVPKGTQAACPACRAEGKDTAGDNLLIYPTGRYQCARFIYLSAVENHAHNQEIYRLVGFGDHNDER